MSQSLDFRSQETWKGKKEKVQTQSIFQESLKKEKILPKLCLFPPSQWSKFTFTILCCSFDDVRIVAFKPHGKSSNFKINANFRLSRIILCEINL